MLRKIRIIVALITFVGITLLFLDFAGLTHRWLGWLARIQFVPALLAMNVGIVLGLLLLTGLFGRVYCSAICPLGVFQDVVSCAGTRKKKWRFSYSPAKTGLRYGMLLVFILAFVVSILASVHWLFALLDPYSAYGRIASNLLAPFYGWGNNLLAYLAERMDSYAFYPVEVWIRSGLIFVVAIITFAGVGYLAWRHGRTYCNTICPVGTLLGLVSRYSLFAPVFDSEKCNKCGLCARSCKASCIDAKNRRIDYSRCVACMNCVDTCNRDAMTYTLRAKGRQTESPSTADLMTAPVKQEQNSRRRFLSATSVVALTTVAAKAQELHVDGGLADIEEKKEPARKTPVVPPGGEGVRHFGRHCTACQLCVSVCPNPMLRPSSKMGTFMQPEITYEWGYCRPECTKCSEVCPTGAIRRITTAEKSALQIGRAVWLRENCVVNRDEVPCRSCERHCPTGAILLVPRDPADPDSLKIPAIDTERCIGCGACEHLCPARPYSAIYVEGNERHHLL